MIRNTLPGLDYARDGTSTYCARRSAPLRRRRLRRGPTTSTGSTNFPRLVAGARRARPSRHHGGRGVGRFGSRLSRPLRRHGRNLARFGRRRAVLRRALQSLCQSDQAQWQCRAEETVFAQADFRRACRRAGHAGAECRLGRRVDAHARRPARRSVCPQRFKDVDHQRTAGGDDRRLCQD